MFKRKMANLKGKQPKNGKDQRYTTSKILLLYDHLCSAISTSVIVWLYVFAYILLKEREKMLTYYNIDIIWAGCMVDLAIQLY